VRAVAGRRLQTGGKRLRSITRCVHLLMAAASGVTSVAQNSSYGSLTEAARAGVPLGRIRQ
jgi:hypothetical protein